MKFRVYDKIHRLGKEETDGILDGLCYIQEKVDGANTSVWLDDFGEIRCGSRTQDVTEGSFNGFVEYVKNHEGIKTALKENPNCRLYLEWLVRHTIPYKETCYRKAYLFDVDVYIGNEEGEFMHEFMTVPDVYTFAEKYNIEVVPFITSLENPTLEQITEHVGKSSFGDRGEGVVIKRPEFRNKFGDRCYAKVVTESFKEDNALVFGGNNKHSDTYWEVYVVQKYITLARVQKIMNKIEPELNERFDMKHIPRIMGTVYHDMITEEAWDIVNKVAALDFKILQRIAYKKIKQIYVDIITDSVSVADASQEEI